MVFNQKGASILISIITLSIVILGSLLNYKLSNYIPTISVNNSTVNNLNSQLPSQQPPLSGQDSDIVSARDSFNKIVLANKNRDNNLMNQYTTKNTLALGANFIWYKDIKFNSISKENNQIIINQTSVKDNGAEETMDIVFLKEDGVWKLDLSATIQYTMNKQNQAVADSPKEGTVDCVVTGVQVFPNPPKVNDLNTEIQVTIKNQGTKATISQGCPAVASIIGSEFPVVQGGLLYTLLPGESEVWSFHPYGEFWIERGDKDNPGIKTIEIIIDKYSDIQESNTTNNKFTTQVNFVQ